MPDREKPRYPSAYASGIAELARLSAAGSPDTDEPTDEQIREVLDAVFFASLLREEGRSVELSVSIEHVSSLATEAEHQGYMLFEAPVPLTPDALRKLAPSIDSRESDLVIDRREGHLCIAGITYHKARQSLNARSGAIRSRGVRITSLEPGALTVSIGGVCALRYGSGEGAWFEVPLTSGSHHRTDLGERSVIQGMLETYLPPTQVPGEREQIAASLLNIAQLMSDESHGGLVLVVPTARSSDGLSDAMGHAFGPDAREVLRQASRRWLSAAPNGASPIVNGLVSHEAISALQELRSTERFVAMLTRIDGAVVLGQDMAILRIGAQITASGEEEVDVLDVYNPRTGTSSLGLVGVGTRHRSAIRFCRSAGEPVIAIIASQDGVVSMLFGHGDATRMVRPVLFPPHGLTW